MHLAWQMVARIERYVALRYGLSIAIVVLATALLLLIRVGIGLEVANISLGYIVAVLLAAITYGLGAGVVASVAAFLAYNFFFVEPLYEFTVANRQDVTRLVLFLVVAIITSSIAARARSQAQQARHRAEVQEALYELSQMISIEVEAAAILPIIAQQIVRLLGVDGCMIVLFEGGVPGTTTAGNAGSEGTAVVTPLRIGDRTLGMVRVWERPAQIAGPEARRLLDTLARQAALAVERTRLADEATRLQIVAESDRTKSALLHSVSHDLRTPITAIKGAVSNLLDESVVWNDAAEQTLLTTIDGEVDRLNLLVRNLLDMSRIEAGVFVPPTELAMLEDVIGPVLYRLRRITADRPLTVDIPTDLPFIPMAVPHVDQIFTNLLENAVKYTPPDTPLTISARVVNDTVQVDVADAGPGVPAAERERIFDKFYRLGAPETSSGGTGLGLAICKYLVEVHGGTIWTHPRVGGGAIFSFTLPLRRPLP